MKKFFQFFLWRFYDEFKKSEETCLINFYRSYHPPISAEHHTCVGLSLELIHELFVLEERFPGLIERLYLASCEECVDDIISYASELPDPYDSEKEHVLVALKLNIAGRSGILLLDPGYHIGRAVTVMQDCCYPHTGEKRQTYSLIISSHRSSLYNAHFMIYYEFIYLFFSFLIFL